MCCDPPLLCDLGEVHGAPWDRFPQVEDVAGIYHSLLSCPEDLLPQETKEPSTGKASLAAESAGPVRKRGAATRQ